jgi:hypothetical protein
MSRFLAAAIFLLSSVPAYSMPQFLELYRKDPFRNANVDGCNTCHMSPQGGDARNAFGQAFDDAGYQITALLRAQFPDRFTYPISRVSDALIIHFSDPDKKQVIVEASGMKNLVDLDKLAVNGNPATNTTSPTRIVTPAETSQAGSNSEVRVDQDAREGAFFGANIVNLPNGKPQKAGGVDFFVGHRFTADVKTAGFGRLFGFDSGAVIAFGVRAGVTDRLSVSVLRSNLDQTISLGSAFQITRQNASMPVTLQVRAGVDGLRNFGLYRKKKNPAARQYSPYIQGVFTRTFNDRLSFSFVPTFAFNTREEEVLIPESALGADHNDTIALGIGLGYRFYRSASIVGEYIPRVWGLRSERRNIPGFSKDQERFSIGLQKSTFRHTFELLITRQFPMTPPAYSFQGNDRFSLGFNIYRKLR